MVVTFAGNVMIAFALLLVSLPLCQWYGLQFLALAVGLGGIPFLTHGKLETHEA